MVNKKSITYQVIFTFIVTFILVLILTITKNSIGDGTEKLFISRAYLDALGVEYGDDPINRYEEVFKSKDFNSPKFDINYNGKELLVVPVSGNGLWGVIYGVLAVDKDLSKIHGIGIISHQETPGLGARIEEPWFRKQFQGEVIGKDGIHVVKGGSGDYDPKNSEVDGITGASRTSESIESIVNKKIEALRKGGE